MDDAMTGWLPETGSLDISTLLSSYKTGRLTPTFVAKAVLRRIAASKSEGVWIHLVQENELLSRARDLEIRIAREGFDSMPLFGIPFSVKDNIDVAGLPTTAGCPAFAYVAPETASVVANLESLGAMLVGKTNLDQFAAGLVGTRSPYGVCRNPFDPKYISGGSSAGSAVSVSAGLVSFSLGTDTAGSGRVPAGFQNIVGLKPTRGLLSTRGVVPACRSLDCVSVFALTCGDALKVFEAAASYDPSDPFSRPSKQNPEKREAAFRFGVPAKPQRMFYGDSNSESLFDQAISRLESLGGTAVSMDFELFARTAALLYEGPWLAERAAAIRPFLETNAADLLPVTRAIIEKSAQYSAVELFEAQYRLLGLQRDCREAFQNIDFLVVPTAPTVYAIEDVEQVPVGLNTTLGYYTNFVNLLDLCALAIPNGFLANGLPMGITMIAPASSDRFLAAWGKKYHEALGGNLGATATPLVATPLEFHESHPVKVAVAGLHLQGQPLNHELTDLGAQFVRAAATSPTYALHAVRRGEKTIPGLTRNQAGGAAIALEIWAMDFEAFGKFTASVKAPLCIGSVELESGEIVKGFLCENHAVASGVEITRFGGWLAYLKSTI